MMGVSKDINIITLWGAVVSSWENFFIFCEIEGKDVCWDCRGGDEKRLESVKESLERMSKIFVMGWIDLFSRFLVLVNRLEM